MAIKFYHPMNPVCVTDNAEELRTFLKTHVANGDTLLGGVS